MRHRILGLLAAAALAPLAMLIAGCPFSAETFQRKCNKTSDCADGNPCTEDKCTDGVCENPDKPKESPCGKSGDSVCDGKGKCVECLSNADCLAHHATTPICDTVQQKCVSCTDGIKNGKEADVDCGGPDCGACLGQPCDPQNGCGKGTFCAMPENICCSSACDKKCEACSKAKTGQPDGTCAPVPFGKDPDGECASLGACGASPNTCRCEDGVKNGDESDVDCGGSACPKCEGGKTCGTNVDCAADVPECVDGACCQSLCQAQCRYCDVGGKCVDVPAGYDDLNTSVMPPVPWCPGMLTCGPSGAGCVGKAGATCSSNSACLSGICSGGKCQPGGLTKSCSTNSDCSTGTCQNYVCSP
jgi:hypothetical protein